MANEIKTGKLIAQYLRQELTGQEKEELDAWLALSPINREFMEIHAREEVISADLKILQEKNGDDIRRGFEVLREANIDLPESYNYSGETTPARPYTRRWTTYIAAAVFIGLLLFAWLPSY